MAAPRASGFPWRVLLVAIFVLGVLGAARVALVIADPGGGRYSVRFLTKTGDETVDDGDIAGRICRP